MSQILSQFLPYFRLDDGSQILWMKDGSASMTFRLTPRNTSSFTNDEFLALRSGLTTTLNQLPDGSTVQVLLKRFPSTDSDDPALRNWRNLRKDESLTKEPLQRLFAAKSQEILQEQSGGCLFQTEILVTVFMSAAVKKPAQSLGPLSHLNIFSSKTKYRSRAEIAALLEEATKGIKLSLISQGYECEDITGSEKLKRIFERLNPDRTFNAEMFPDAAKQNLSDQLVLTDLIETKGGLMLGRRPMRIGTLKALPENTIPSLLTLLSGLNIEFELVITAMALDQNQEKERLSRKQRLMTGLAGGNAVRNLTAENQLTDIEDTLSSMISHGEKLFAASFHILSMSGDAQGFESVLMDCERLGAGCQWFEETVGAFPAFFSILPFAPSFISRPKRLLGSVLSDLLPLYGWGQGHTDAEVLFETQAASLMGYSLFEKSPSANAILIGSTGSGKSTLANGLLLGMVAGREERAPSSFVIDVGNSFKRSVLYLGGASIELTPGSETRINPFDLPVGESRPSPEKVKFLTALFDEVLGDEGNLTKLERSLLESEIFSFYEKAGPRTLSKFREHLATSDATELRRLSRLLSLWCQPQPYGLLFDGDTTVKIDAKYLHFELKGCQRYPDLLRVAMLVVMDLCWGQVKARFPKRSLLIIDETHTIIRPSSDGRSNTAARWVEDCFRQMRKFSSAAIAISQTAKDLKTPEIGDGLLANAPNRFILRQRGDEKTLREDLRLTDQEINDVFSLRQVQGEFSEFYLHSESVKSILIYKPTPLELWLSTTHPPDNELLQAQWKENPSFSLVEIMDHMAKRFPHGAPAPHKGVAA